MSDDNIFITFDPCATKHRTILGSDYSNSPDFVSREFFDFLREIAARQVATAYRDARQWLNTVKECLEVYESELGSEDLGYKPLDRFETFAQEVERASNMVDFLKELCETEFLDDIDMGGVDTSDIELQHMKTLRMRHVSERMNRKDHDPLEGTTDNDIGLSSYDSSDPFRAVYYPAMYSRVRDHQKIWLPNVRVLLKPQKEWKDRNRPEPFYWRADDPAQPWLSFSPRETAGEPFDSKPVTLEYKEPIPRDPMRVIFSFTQAGNVIATFDRGIKDGKVVYEEVPVGTSVHADKKKSELQAQGYTVIWRGKETEALERTRVKRTVKHSHKVNWVRISGLPVFPGNGFNCGSAQLGAPHGMEYERRKNYTGPCKYSFGGFGAETMQSAFLQRLALGKVELCRYRNLSGRKSPDHGKLQAWSVINGMLHDGTMIKVIVFCDLRRNKD